MKRKPLYISLVLGTAFSVISTVSEAKTLHVIAQTVQQAYIGDPANPQLGDRIILNVDLFDDDGGDVGTGAGVCTIFSVPPLDTLVECLSTAVFAEGQIVFGGVAPLPTVGAQAEFGILGGTGAFSKARGTSLQIVTAPGVIDATFDIRQ